MIEVAQGRIVRAETKGIEDLRRSDPKRDGGWKGENTTVWNELRLDFIRSVLPTLIKGQMCLEWSYCSREKLY